MEVSALPFLQVAFTKLFGQNGDDGPATKKRRYAGPGAEEDAAWQERNRNYIMNCVRAVNEPVFRILLIASYVAKGPFRRAFHWMQKRIKEHRLAVQKAADQHEGQYLGPILFMLPEYKALSFKFFEIILWTASLV